MNIAWIVERTREDGGIAHALCDTVSGFPREFPLVFVTPERSSFPRLELTGWPEYKILLPQKNMRAVEWGVANILRIRRLCKTLNLDTLICDHTGGLFLACLAKTLGLVNRVVYRNHGAEFLASRRYKLLSYALRNVDLCLALNAEDASIITNCGISDVRILPNPLPPHCAARQSYLEAEGKRAHSEELRPCVGYVGAASNDKGIAHFQEVARLVYTRHHWVRFLLVGAGCAAAAESLRRTLQCGSDDRTVESFESLPRERLFGQLDVLCVCSRRESFSLVCVEAPFYGCLPIAFASPGPAWLRESGNEIDLVPQGDAHSMAAKVLETLHDPARRAARCLHLCDTLSYSLSRTAVIAELLTCLSATNS